MPEHQIALMTKAGMCQDEIAFAKDQSVDRNKIRFLLSSAVKHRNVLVDHDRLMEKVKNVIWIVGISTPFATALMTWAMPKVFALFVK